MSITHSTEIINGEAVTILIETTDSQDSTAQTTERTRAITRGVASDTLRHAQNVFSDGVALVRHCATQVVTGVQSLDDSLKPETIEVQLAIKLGSSAGPALLVNLSSEAQMQVKLIWKLKNTPNP
jgi:hypothetical protein